MSRFVSKQDVLFALGFTPYDVANPLGYVDTTYFNANLPALAAPLAAPSFTGQATFSGGLQSLGLVDVPAGLLNLSSTTPRVLLGLPGSASTPRIDFLALSAAGRTYDASMAVTGGSATVDGRGIINFVCSALTINGASIPIAGTGTPGTILPLPESANALVGASGSFAREDHVHAYPVAPVFATSATVGGDTATAPLVTINGAAASNRVMRVRTASTDRWQLGATNTAETGSSAGSDFAIRSYSDAGTQQAVTPLFVKRSTGHVLIGAGLTPADDANGGALQVAGSARVSIATGTFPAPPASTALQVLGAASGGFTARVLADAFAANGGFTGRRANGSATSPTALAANDVIASLHGWGYGATGYSTGYRGAVNVVAGGTWTDTDQSTTLTFETTPATSTAPAVRARILPSGRVLLNTATDDGTNVLQVSGGAAVSGAVAAGSVAATGAISAASATVTGNLGAATVALGADPTTALQAATKQYVDNRLTFRNLIHNSMFNIGQRGAGPWTTAGIYTLDRWLMNFAGGTLSVLPGTISDTQRTAQIGDEAATTSLQWTVAGGSGASDEAYAEQRIEGVRSTAGRTLTLSFWAAASSGTPKLGLLVSQVFGTGGSPSATVLALSQAVTLSATYARYTVTFAMPSVAGKTFGTTAGTDYLAVRFGFSAGSTASANYGGIGVQSFTGTMWGVQIEIGPVATPVERVPTAIDVVNCQRFYQVVQGTVSMYSSGSGANIYFPLSLPSQMRAAPTAAVSTNGGSGYASVTVQSVGANTLLLTTVSNAAGSVSYNYTATASADL